MNRLPPVCWLLLAQLLLWPMAASGHGPGGHATDARHATPATEAAQRAGATSSPPDGSVAQGEQVFPDPAPTTALPLPLEAVNPDLWVEEKTGGFVPLDTIFRNERGETVSLRQLIDRPTLLLPIYYRCPTGCSFELANLADAIRRSRHGFDSFRVLSFSFDASETPATAAEVRPNYTQLLAKDFPPDAWPFLTGEEDSILRLTGSIGFRFQKKDDSTFIHASALIVLDREGRIIKYVYGSFIPGDVDLALTEAARGTPASSIRRLLAFCFPANPRQTQQVLSYLKMGSGAVLLVGGLCFLLFLRRKKTDQPHFTP